MQPTPLWYKDAIFYELYIRAFKDSNGDGHGDIRGVIEKLDYLQDLGINCIWLLPMFPSPLKDDGYDVADFYNIHPDYGTLNDFKELVDEAHKRSIRVIADLVLNHTSDQHAWFQEARKGPDNPKHDYYVWSDTAEKYQDARIIFLDTEESNWSWDEQAKRYFWHRFYSSQPDLNYDNPEVQEAMLQVAKFWLDIGIDGFRCDAIPYLIEREGTNCENLPETHEYLKKLRRFVDEHAPDSILLSEANQWPEDVREYFGDGEGDEMHMAFHFPVMPRLFMAMRKEDTAPIREIIERTPEIPENAQWCTFLRNHDELTLEMVTEEERQWMWEQYAPEPRMRLNLGIRRRLAPLLDNDFNKIVLANSLLFTLPGSPIVYYGDEIGMGDDIWLDDRDGVRTPMQWETSRQAGFSASDTTYSPVISAAPYDPAHVNVEDQMRDLASLYYMTKNMIAVRKTHRAFGWGTFEWATTSHPTQVAAYFRRYEGEELLILNNLSSEEIEVSVEIPDRQLFFPPPNLFTGRATGELVDGRLSLRLAGHGYEWLKLS
ncbi:MAG: maltose alpha-D-glucosyltransferase [Anaerolineales bacterium]|nr:MAG: maltose alpha-D-glucosyltransferase [Anaerolineales bacterium]